MTRATPDDGRSAVGVAAPSIGSCQVSAFQSTRSIGAVIPRRSRHVGHRRLDRRVSSGVDDHDRAGHQQRVDGGQGGAELVAEP